MKTRDMMFGAFLLLLPVVASAVTRELPPQDPATVTRPAWPATAHRCPIADYYTPDMIAAGAYGRVSLLLTIAADGTVRDPLIEISSGNDAVDAAAVRCARTWRYTPATLRGKPVEVDWKTHVNFAINGDAGPPGVIIMPAAASTDVCPERRPGAKPAAGQAVLYFIVDTEGRVTSLSLREPSGDSAFDDYLMSCVAGWRYAPATRDGVPFAIGHKERLSW